MLPKAARLTSREFDLLIEKGRVTHSPLFVMRHMPLPAGEKSRFAAVAPVKIAKTSVARHALRRRIYSAVRPIMADVREPVRVALFAKQTTAGADVAAMTADLRQIFVKAGLLR